MVILDHPFISDLMTETLAARRVPVLRNDAVMQCPRRNELNLLDSDAFAARLKDGGRLYLNSENPLSWVFAHDPVPERVRGIRLMKDKHAFREALRPMYPDYHFTRFTFAELGQVDPAGLRLPLVLKPSVGFFSVGVFVIQNADDWSAAMKTLSEKWPVWQKSFPPGVLGELYFTAEDYIKGDEYAIDAYFDENGKAVVLNVMKHEFADAADVRDRLYYVRPDQMEGLAARFAEYLDRVGKLVGLTDFPFHAEVRIVGDPDSGLIIPIEFNPLRFAGVCTTDIARYACGIFTYMAFLDNEKPDWKTRASKASSDYYSLIMLDKPHVPLDGMELDTRALCNTFTEVFEIRMFPPESSAFGYMFTRTPADNRGELDRILRSDLTEFLRPSTARQ